MNPIDKDLSDIAARHLRVPNMETRGNDDLDFHECAVWNIKAALIAAYESGKKS